MPPKWPADAKPTSSVPASTRSVTGAPAFTVAQTDALKSFGWYT